jgi:catechol 2,3-dioxygenase-like lactoylglutathione lyase family enzyme
MPTRFDHAVIAVRDLETALVQFQRLGFDARPGGRHASGATHNGLIRFGLDYVELLAVYDEAVARAEGHGLALLDVLEGKEAAFAGYALATANIEEDARHFVGVGTQIPQPRAMQRNRPDGKALTWRVVSPSETSWKRPWPFLIQWDTPDEERLTIDVLGQHPNRAIGWRRIAVAVHDLPGAVEVYHQQLGLELVKQDTCSVRVARRAVFSVGQSVIEVLSPEGDGLVQEVLEKEQEGPFAIYFTVGDLAATRAYLEAQHIGFVFEAAGTGRIVLDPSETFGLRINLLA